VPANGASAARVAIPYERLAVRIDGAWRVEPGPYEIAVGRHARDPQAVIVSVHVDARTLTTQRRAGVSLHGGGA
jgi:hypothetical protein